MSRSSSTRTTPSVTGSGSTFLDEWIAKLSSLLGVTGNEYDDTGLFEASTPYTGPLAAAPNKSLKALLRQVDAGLGAAHVTSTNDVHSFANYETPVTVAIPISAGNSDVNFTDLLGGGEKALTVIYTNTIAAGANFRPNNMGSLPENVVAKLYFVNPGNMPTFSGFKVMGTLPTSLAAGKGALYQIVRLDTHFLLSGIAEV